MTYAPQNPVEVPPFQLQRIIPDITESYRVEGAPTDGKPQVRCAQAFGSEIYVGCSNGELIRYALQADDPTKLESYTVLSRKSVPGEKPIDEIVLIPSLSRALILSDRQIHFYTLPSLEIFPIKPIRHALALAVDDQHLKRLTPPLSATGMPLPVEAVEFSVIKRSSIAMFSLKERLLYQKEIPLPPNSPLVSTARRTGKSLCIGDSQYYSIVDTEANSLFQILPVSQSPDPAPFEVKPLITVVSPNEFLILSWTGASTLGLFVTGDGDPVRGTLEWPSYPLGICLDYPHITSLLPNNTIEIHSVDTQAIVQVIGAPAPAPTSPLTSPPTSPRTSHPASSPTSPPRTAGHARSSSTASNNANAKSNAKVNGVDPSARLTLVSSVGGYLVPSTQRSEKMSTVPVKLIRT